MSGTAVLAAGAYVGTGVLFRGRPGPVEQAVFSTANHGARRHAVLRVPQQLGTPWTLPVLAVGGLATGRPHLALRAACALPLEKALEVGLKKILQRPRPARVDDEVELRDDAPTEGPSYPPATPRSRPPGCCSQPRSCPGR
ncbi:hypothetical protein [Nocardioides mesophilus]|uniref:hypothetical protein n=1 Tax=Nocardioides mesophilus TaxID=433659 RepID=UPI001FE2E095|nr:hypothetical protein [Nocardioides mesophilus]